MQSSIDRTTRDEVCVVALADAFRGDGEILCSPMGIVATCAGQLARATFAPDMMLSDGAATLISTSLPIGANTSERTVEGYAPFRTVFDLTWSGKRHVVMGASQIDMWGNQNISAIGPRKKPTVQLLGLRGAPSNAINHPVSYWIPNHTRRTFVDRVDTVCAPGYDRIKGLPLVSTRSFEIRRVVSNLGVFDFATNDNRMRLVSRHPGVTIREIVDATTFELQIADDDLITRSPTTTELRLLRESIDPTGLRRSDFN